MKEKIITVIKNIIVFIILLLSFTISITMNWIYKTFGNIGLEEILFQINVPSTNTNVDYFYDYINNALVYILLYTIITFILLCFIFRKRKIRYAKRMKDDNKDKILVVYKRLKINKKYIGKILVALIILVISITYTINKTEFISYANKIMEDSNFIKDEYIDPQYTNITFPEKNRNLIYIYLESMEATFYSKENGGAFEESLISDLEELASENIVFSTSKNYKGLYSLPGSTWTTGAMTAQTMGLPLKIPIEYNSYGEYATYLPGAIGIGDILKAEGYNQMLEVGSFVTFGGRDHLFKQHGNYEIFDFLQSVNDGRKELGDYVWWGFPDTDLFEYAKEKISILAEDDKPFNFTMLTVDTHSINGYQCEKCEEIFDEPYFNVLNCSAKQVKEFVEWIQEQEFYENTTIVICGDHPSMQPETFDYLNEEGYERTVLNIIINPAILPEGGNVKDASTMDMFPTTLASLGIQIEGNRLGLGTNLFSNEKTLIEQYGLEYVQNELKKSSSFYNEKFLYGY